MRRSLLQPDLCHRESEFFDLQDEARRRVLDVYGLDPATWSAVLVTGSGTAAVESMIASLVPADGRLLVVDNGVYGDRIAQIATTYGIDHAVSKHDWMRPLDLDAIGDALDADRDITHVAAIHHETTTGRLNDLDAIAALCRDRGVGLLVDGVSSFGAEAIPFDDPSIAAVAGAANKCLHGTPGASFVVVRRDALARAKSRAFYLDLARLARLQDQRGTPFTPAVHAYYALVEALREFEDEGGRVARHARYASLAEQARRGFEALGVASVLPPEQSSVVLRSYDLPRGVELRDAARRAEVAWLRDLRGAGRPVEPAVPHLDDGRDRAGGHRPAGGRRARRDGGGREPAGGGCLRRRRDLPSRRRIVKCSNPGRETVRRTRAPAFAGVTALGTVREAAHGVDAATGYDRPRRTARCRPGEGRDRSPTAETIEAQPPSCFSVCTFSRSTSAFGPPSRRIDENSERRVASSLIVPLR